MKIINAEEFKELTASGVVLVDFYADWCGPCKMMGPVLENLSKEFEGKVSFYKVNVDDEGDLAAEYQIMSIPNMVILKDGELADRIIGVMPKDQVAAKLNAVLG